MESGHPIYTRQRGLREEQKAKEGVGGGAELETGRGQGRVYIRGR